MAKRLMTRQSIVLALTCCLMAAFLSLAPNSAWAQTESEAAFQDATQEASQDNGYDADGSPNASGTTDSDAVLDDDTDG